MVDTETLPIYLLTTYNIKASLTIFGDIFSATFNNIRDFVTGLIYMLLQICAK